MTPELKKKLYKIWDITSSVLIWLFVAFSALITIMVFAAQNNIDGVPSLFGKSFITIETPSMTPTYEVGDLVFLTKIPEEEKRNLQPGTIITYHAPIDINGDGSKGDLNTHRIETNNNGVFTTKGDNNERDDGYNITYADIVGVCEEDGKIGGIGNVIGFLRTQLGFFLCIVLPLILFFLYELYVFISILVTEKAKKAPVAKETEEEIKRKAIEEYLRSQGIAVPPAEPTPAPAPEPRPEPEQKEEIKEPENTEIENNSSNEDEK